MKKILIYSLVLILLVPLIGAVNYEVEIKYSNKYLNITSVKIDYFSNYNLIGGNDSITLKDYEGNVLLMKSFEFDPITTMHYRDNKTNEIIGKEIELDEMTFRIFLPYFENATTIELYDSRNEKVSNYSLADFTKVDFNQLSSALYGNETGNESLKTGEDKKGKDKGFVEKIKNYWYILVLILILISSYLIYKLKKKR